MLRIAKIFVFTEDCDREKENAATPKNKLGPSFDPLQALSPEQIYLKSLQKPLYYPKSPTPLLHHNLTPLHRQQVIEWLTEVCLHFSSKQAFFMTVKLMDQFFESFSKPLSPSDLHLVSITSLLISSKFLDVVPLKLRTLSTKVCMNKYTLTEILSSERIFLETLEFNLNLPTIHDFLMFLAQKHQFSIEFLYSCEVLAFLMQMSYELLRFNCEELALGCVVFVAGRSKSYFFEEAAKVLSSSTKVSIESITQEIEKFWLSLPLRSVNLDRLSKFFQLKILKPGSPNLFKFNKPHCLHN